MDEPDTLTPLEPAYVKVMRISASIFGALVLAGAILLEVLQLLPMGMVILPVLLLFAYLIGIVPARRYRRWGYDTSQSRLRVVQGYLFYSDTIVPFGRIQHIDVDQGPVQRRYGLATLSVHTAGSHNDTVSLPGLLHTDALALREMIRAHIQSKQG
jgi:uncharacterized protein